jgi:mono/diheme cytochrome c family protein
MKKVLKGLGWLVLLLVVAAAGFYGLTSYKFAKGYDAPLPAIKRSTDPKQIARSEKIFRTVCAGCHLADSGRATGHPLPEFPKFMGEFHSANITSDPTGGVGAWSDEELARVIKTGIGRDGKLRVMPQFRFMGDDDVAGIVGFMRSSDPMFAPVAEKAPASRPAFAGKMIFTWSIGIRPDLAKEGTPTPAKARTAEFGKYIASQYDCYFCHTAGFSGKKLEEPNLFAGGFEYTDDKGRTFYSPNLTFSEQGIAAYTLPEFTNALRNGIARDGTALRFPMPQLRFSDDDEIAAIYEYLKTIPKSSTPYKLGTAPPRKKPDANATPEALFADLGCALCHGEKGPFREKIRECLKKSPDEIARWIRNPEASKPGTQMPTFASVVDEKTALTLASWVQDYAKNVH